MLNTPFSPWPSYTEEEASAVSQVLLSNRVNYWTGVEAREFEKEFAQWAGTEYAIALSNGTVALDLSLLALGIGKDDEVIVTSRTFIASVSSIISVGAKPVFADVDRNTQNISADSIRAVLTRKTKAIICVHLAGCPCDMDPIMELAALHNLYVIEDCAQAHGAYYKNRSVGSIGHVSAWSFCQDKIMSTGGEGGMVTTNDKRLWQWMWSFKDHGKSWEAVNRVRPTTSSDFRWVHDSFGTNWRMTEMQAVIGRIQLKRMAEWQRLRLKNMLRIWGAASECSLVRVPVIPDYMKHAAYKCYVFLESDQLGKGWDRSRVVKRINECGVPCYTGSCSEVYLEKAFDTTRFRPLDRLPIAKELGETSLMFLVHPTLTNDEIDKTCQVLHDVLKSAQKSQFSENFRISPVQKNNVIPTPPNYMKIGSS